MVSGGRPYIIFRIQSHIINGIGESTRIMVDNINDYNDDEQNYPEDM